MRLTLLKFSTVVWFGTAVVLAGCTNEDAIEEPLFKPPKTLVSYDTEIKGLPNEDMVDIAESALSTYKLQSDGAQSIPFLRRRAQSDEATIQRLLRSRGYYNGSVEITVTETTPTTEEEIEEAVETDDDDDDEKEREAKVVFDVTPGPQFNLLSHELQIESRGKHPEITAKEMGSPVGGPAIAAKIVDAETKAVVTLKDAGFPYTTRGKRKALADLEQDTLEVTTPIDAGPLSVFGSVVFEGLEEVEEEYLRTYLDFEVGQTFSQQELEDYQTDLLSTDLFNTLSVRAPDEAPEGETPVALPIVVTAEERKKRTFSASARYNTDTGPSVLLGYENRNLFGSNETFTAEAEAGTEVQRLTFGYREPQYLRDGQDFVAGLNLEHDDNDAFNAYTATLTAGLQRELTPEWTVGAGGLIEASLIENPGEDDSTSYLGGIPVFASYDGANDLLNPTKGIRFRADVTPYAGIFDSEFVDFLKIDTVGATYFDLTGQEKYILAARGRLGTIVADSLDSVPKTIRLYSGGGGSIRGYEQRSIGPLDSDNDPIGGLSVVELGGELRAQFYGDLGGVLFVGAGAVSEEIYPSFTDGLQVGAGFGLRYYSPAGPIRVDVAFPVNKRPSDSAFQLYFSIGQAF
ncbi:BamA/TamA family outer membrane protein [Rhodobacteraceae bacterium NNCM2]|nr:BamA/TamA family outer membrane protein [Coraliihabitans acroporae]